MPNTAPVRALVLAGGGAKGSYQIGVWRALQELDWHPAIITGASVGTLNGCMFTLGKAREELSRLSGALHSLSPLGVLGRGYAIASDREGRPIRSVSELEPGKVFRLRLRDGEALCETLEKEETP